MGSKSGQLHIFFFPFLAHGHLIPTIDIAKLFTARGVKATIVTTPRNVPLVSKTHGMKIDILIIKFPAVEAGLPQGCENCDSLNSPEMASNFIKATKMLQQPLEQLLQDYNPNCLVADSFFPWATDVASKFGIPRLVFNGISFFSMFADHTIRLYEPHKKYIQQEVETDFSKFLKEVMESELRSYGFVVNSFYELEPDYADHYRKLLDIATGLEASGQQFIWVVRKVKNDEKEEEDWLNKGFEKSMEGKGLIIRGWAPQVLILDHEAVGGFVTHCGWNSILEGVTAGVPMVTWPMSGEQFYNEKLVTQVLEIGIGVGAQKWGRVEGDSIKSEAIEKAVRRIMVGEEAEEMRGKAKALGEMARRAVEEGGSSYSDLNALIEELR
uniref:Uncharacterized protein n=1 Tax=Fagus sylvatica TaxID=28930 RepID=A0A2N9G5J8_FAGSY